MTPRSATDPAKGGPGRFLKKAALPGILLFAGYCSVYGGEYSWFELRDARAAVEAERAELGAIRGDVDSLAAFRDSLQTDSATLERVAREDWGLVRDGETIYRFERDSAQAPDSAGSR